MLIALSYLPGSGGPIHLTTPYLMGCDAMVPSSAQFLSFSLRPRLDGFLEENDPRIARFPNALHRWLNRTDCHTNGTRVIETPPFDVGPALGAPPHPAPPERTEGRYQVVTADGSDRIVDARHGRLGIDTAGEFVPTLMSKNTAAGQG